jgi:hypothetical protein
MSIEFFFSHFERLYNHSLACSMLPLSYAGCHKFWGVIYLLGLALLFVVCVMAVMHIYNESVAFKAYQKRLEDRARVADEDVMQSVKWSADAHFDALTEAELAQSFRQSLKQSN